MRIVIRPNLLVYLGGGFVKNHMTRTVLLTTRAAAEQAASKSASAAPACTHTTGSTKTTLVPPTDFTWVESPEPHVARRKAILAAHPKIKALYGPDVTIAYQVVFVVALQTVMAACAPGMSWPLLLCAAYCVGAFASQNLFLAVHELSHFLAFKRTSYNRVLGFVANWPVVFAMSISFREYHLEHHLHQGVDGIDVDIPTNLEARYVVGRIAKLWWASMQLFFYAFRPMVVRPKVLTSLMALNWLSCLAYDACILFFFGPKALAYLVASTLLAGSLHPMAGHFIAEHYLSARERRKKDGLAPQETLVAHPSTCRFRPFFLFFFFIKNKIK